MLSHHDPANAETFLAAAMADWGGAVYRLALSQTRSRADAEDVYQDVFLRLYNDRTEFQTDEHLKAWLLRVTANRCHDLAKSAWHRRTVALDPEQDTPVAAAHDADNAALWDAVRQLPEQQRMAVHLHYVEGYPTEDIARILSCQPATVRTWLFRARARIKALMEREHADDEDAAEGPHCASRPPTPERPHAPYVVGSPGTSIRRQPSSQLFPFERRPL